MSVADRSAVRAYVRTVRQGVYRVIMLLLMWRWMDGGGVDIIKCMHSINVARNFRRLSLVRVHVHVL